MARAARSRTAWTPLEKGTGGTRDLTPVILDSPLRTIDPDGPVRTVLMLPQAGGRLIDRMIPPLARLGNGKVLVAGVPQVEYEGLTGYGRQVRVLSPAALEKELGRCESGDYLLLVQPRYWPLAGFDFEGFVRSSHEHAGATHAIAVGRDRDSAQERVECDAEGRVRRVQRVYRAGGWAAQPAGTVVCCIVPAKALSSLRFASLADLRKHLAGRGVLTSDIPLPCDAVDLAEPGGVLSWMEQQLDALVNGPAGALTRVRPGVLAGRHCRIAPSARLVGPVVVQAGAAIEEDATVVGPVVVGAGAKIEARAVVSRTLLLAGATVEAGGSACSEVIAGCRTAGPASKTDGRDPSGAAPLAFRSGGLSELDSCVSRNLTVADLPARQQLRSQRLQQKGKRLFDAVIAATALLALSPILLIVAGLVKLTSRGPLFFIHRREGLGGREFGCIKFRTMVPDAHLKQREMYGQNQVDGPQFKIANDPRVTPIGAFLRASNLDELPQLFNVLAGQMSLVGPRPSPFRENQICVAWRRARLSVTPGITGIWQICRDRKIDGDFHQWIYYDLAYVRHFGLWLDVKILFWTVASLAGRRRVPLRRLVSGEPDEAHVEETIAGTPASAGSDNGRQQSQPAA